MSSPTGQSQPIAPVEAPIVKPSPWRPWVEVLGLFIIYEGFETARDHAVGMRGPAIEHARWVVDIERWTWTLHEHRLNVSVTHHKSLAQAMNIYYGTIHFLIPPAILIWRWRRHPGPLPAVAQHPRRSHLRLPVVLLAVPGGSPPPLHRCSSRHEQPDVPGGDRRGRAPLALCRHRRLLRRAWSPRPGQVQRPQPLRGHAQPAYGLVDVVRVCRHRCPRSRNRLAAPVPLARPAVPVLDPHRGGGNRQSLGPRRRGRVDLPRRRLVGRQPMHGQAEHWDRARKAAARIASALAAVTRQVSACWPSSTTGWPYTPSPWSCSPSSRTGSSWSDEGTVDVVDGPRATLALLGVLGRRGER